MKQLREGEDGITLGLRKWEAEELASVLYRCRRYLTEDLLIVAWALQTDHAKCLELEQLRDAEMEPWPEPG